MSSHRRAADYDPWQIHTNLRCEQSQGSCKLTGGCQETVHDTLSVTSGAIVDSETCLMIRPDPWTRLNEPLYCAVWDVCYVPHCRSSLTANTVLALQWRLQPYCHNSSMRRRTACPRHRVPFPPVCSLLQRVLLQARTAHSLAGSRRCV
jgi:hypothetical protein